MICKNCSHQCEHTIDGKCFDCFRGVQCVPLAWGNVMHWVPVSERLPNTKPVDGVYWEDWRGLVYVVDPKDGHGGTFIGHLKYAEKSDYHSPLKSPMIAWFVEGYPVEGVTHWCDVLKPKATETTP